MIEFYNFIFLNINNKTIFNRQSHKKCSLLILNRVSNVISSILMPASRPFINPFMKEKVKFHFSFNLWSTQLSEGLTILRPGREILIKIKENEEMTISHVAQIC